MSKRLMLILVMVGLVMAQGPPARGGSKPQNMDAVRIWKLTEVLELTEDQAVAFLPLVQIQERKLREIQGEIQELTQESRKLLKQDKISQKDVDKMIKRYNDKHTEIFKIKNDFIKSLSEHLTPEQQLLYVGFEARFRKELRTYMKDHRGYGDKKRRDQRP